jgi:hypothetical protein
MDLDEEVYFEIEPDGTVETSLLALIARVHRASADDDDPAQENEKVRDSIRAVLNARLGEYEEEKQDETICGAVLKPPPAGAAWSAWTQLPFCAHRKSIYCVARCVHSIHENANTNTNCR